MGEWAPAWELLVNGEPLPAEYRALISEVIVDATIDGADELLIRCSGWDSIGNDFRILGETILAAGNVVTVRMGYHPPDGEVTALQRFQLIREKAHYPEAGHPTMAIRGYSAELRAVEHTAARKSPPETTVDEIAKEIAEFHSLDPAGVQPGAVVVPRGLVKPKGKTDWQYLQELAFRAGYGPPYVQYDEDLDEDVLFFKLLDLNRTDPITFVYNPHVAGTEAASGDLITFTPELSLAGVPTKVEITGFDSAAQQPIRITVEITAGGQESTINTDVGDPAKLSAGIAQGSQLQVKVLESGAVSEKKESIEVLTVETDEDASAFAEKWIRTRNQAFMVARARIKGNAAVWVGQVHDFQGLAVTHNGLWEVQGCKHIMNSSGYHCDLDLARVILEDAEQPAEV